MILFNLLGLSVVIGLIGLGLDALYDWATSKKMGDANDDDT